MTTPRPAAHGPLLFLDSAEPGQWERLLPLGLFHGVPGARRFRQLLSDAQRLRGNDADLVREALAELRPQAA